MPTTANARIATLSNLLSSAVAVMLYSVDLRCGCVKPSDWPSVFTCSERASDRNASLLENSS